LTNGGFCLYATPSFLEGSARLWDPNGSLNQYNISATPKEADNKALLQDWLTVGDDLKMAINDVTTTQAKSK
jgi:hypothetical protein